MGNRYSCNGRCGAGWDCLGGCLVYSCSHLPILQFHRLSLLVKGGGR